MSYSDIIKTAIRIYENRNKEIKISNDLHYGNKRIKIWFKEINKVEDMYGYTYVDLRHIPDQDTLIKCKHKQYKIPYMSDFFFFFNIKKINKLPQVKKDILISNTYQLTKNPLVRGLLVFLTNSLTYPILVDSINELHDNPSDINDALKFKLRDRLIEKYFTNGRKTASWINSLIKCPPQELIDIEKIERL